MPHQLPHSGYPKRTIHDSIHEFVTPTGITSGLVCQPGANPLKLGASPLTLGMSPIKLGASTLKLIITWARFIYSLSESLSKLRFGAKMLKILKPLSQ